MSLVGAELNVRQRMAEKKRAEAYFAKLDRFDRFELGDQLVLGTFSWRDWFTSKPSSVFMRALDDARMLWEMSDGDH